MFEGSCNIAILWNVFFFRLLQHPALAMPFSGQPICWLRRKPRALLSLCPRVLRDHLMQRCVHIAWQLSSLVLFTALRLLFLPGRMAKSGMEAAVVVQQAPTMWMTWLLSEPCWRMWPRGALTWMACAWAPWVCKRRRRESADRGGKEKGQDMSRGLEMKKNCIAFGFCCS